MTAPRVSVVIPVYNLRPYLSEAIESALGQTLPSDELEVIVVDDGSTDDSAAVARRYVPRVRLLEQPNRGVSAARNAGIREARGTFLAFLDADDRIRPGKLAAELAAFAAAPDRGVAYSGWRCIDEAGADLPEQGVPRQEGALLSQLALGNLVHPHAPLVRRDAVMGVGGFDESLSPAADWDLWLRLTRAGLTWIPVGLPLAEYRIRADAMHKDVGRMQVDCLRVLDKLFDDPTLPADVVALRPQAYQNVHLRTACECYRQGRREAGSAAFRAAAELRPATLTEARSLRRLYPLLLPEGQRTGAAVLQHRTSLAVLLAEMLRDLYASPDLDERIAGLRWRSRIAQARARAHFLRRRAAAAVETAAGSHSR
jgi:hypothetical protein